MKTRSGHIRFDRKVTWKRLVPAFRPMFLKFLEETGQTPVEQEVLDVLLEENLRDLKRNRKPEGYNRDGIMRMVFPISRHVEMYVYSRTRTTEVARVTESLSRVLHRYKLKHSVDWDRLTLFESKREA